MNEGQRSDRFFGEFNALAVDSVGPVGGRAGDESVGVHERSPSALSLCRIGH